MESEELIVETLKEAPTGDTPNTGDTVVIHYVGKLMDGTTFDSSRDQGQPLEFVLGGKQVIVGLDQGVQEMRVGELAKLTIPPHLGYGQAGRGPIPSNATLNFEVELLAIKKGN